MASHWGYCGACHGLFWDGDPEKGACPAGGGHQAIGFNFVLPTNQPENLWGRLIGADA